MKFDILVSRLNSLFDEFIVSEGLEQDPQHDLFELFKDIVISFEESDQGLTGVQEMLRKYFQLKYEFRGVNPNAEPVKKQELESELHDLQDTLISSFKKVFIPWDKKRFAAEKQAGARKYDDAVYEDRIDKALEVIAIERGSDRSEINFPSIKDGFLELARVLFKSRKITALGTLATSKPLSHQLSGEKKIYFDKFREFVRTNDPIRKPKLQERLMKLLPEPLKNLFNDFLEGKITENKMVEAIRIY